MALSMLGYRCCANLRALVATEHQALLDGARTRVFDAYVDVSSLTIDLCRVLRANGNSKVIIAIDGSQEFDCGDDERTAVVRALCTAGRDNLLLLDKRDPDKWGTVCAFLDCERPEAFYPRGDEQPPTLFAAKPAHKATPELPNSKLLRFDQSPWIVPRQTHSAVRKCSQSRNGGNVPAYHHARRRLRRAQPECL